APKKSYIGYSWAPHSRRSCTKKTWNGSRFPSCLSCRRENFTSICTAIFHDMKTRRRRRLSWKKRASRAVLLSLIAKISALTSNRQYQDTRHKLYQGIFVIFAAQNFWL